MSKNDNIDFDEKQDDMVQNEIDEARMDAEYRVVEAMERFGGSFVQALAVCFHRADPINFIKLKTTFSEYWNKYDEMSKK